jgi:hypothetical protein
MEKINKSNMIFGYFLLAVALVISAVSAFYSITGLTAIFAAAFWPIIIMGSALEIGKIATTVWLHKYWHQAAMRYKLYLVPAVAILMLITSMGIFGFLSKAHLDQAVPTGDVAAKVSLYDEKIQIQRENIKAARANLSQLDAAVNETMGRSTTESGADKAVAIRRAQARDRAKLMQEIEVAQTTITKLQEERAPIAAEQRKVEAEVGPIKYIAALIYDQESATNGDLLERAVRWVIILIVSVFDPLALVLILAATQTIEWERSDKRARTIDRDKHDVDDEAERAAEANKLIAEIEPDLPPQPAFFTGQWTPDRVGPGLVPKEEPKLDLEELTKKAQELFPDVQLGPNPIAPLPPLELDIPVLENEETWAQRVIDEHDDEHDPEVRAAKKLWKELNPGDTLKNQRARFERGEISELPWMSLIKRTPKSGFGLHFPDEPVKGDTFVKVDKLPTVLYKFNGSEWIPVDKELNDIYTYDDAYIQHLIDKISSGEYDPELLSESEREMIAQHLENR